MKGFCLINTIAIENTTYCGANCIMCNRHEFNCKMENMPMEIFKNGVDSAVRCGVKGIVIAGYGDPLIDEQFPERCQYIKEYYPNIKVSTTSTCQFLKREKLQAVLKYVDEILISMYGMTKSSYESVHRGSLVYEDVLQNITTLLQSSSRPYVVLKYLVLPENEREVKAWQEHFAPLADRIDIWKPYNWGGNAYPRLDEQKFVGCFRIRTLDGLVIRTNGDVSMCCMDKNHDLIIGNITKESLDDILCSSVVSNMQQINETGQIANFGICKDCDMLYNREDALLFSSDRNMQVGKNSAFVR